MAKQSIQPGGSHIGRRSYKRVGLHYTAARDKSIYSIQAAGGVGGGTDVYLNDGTTILLKGVHVSDVFSTTLAGGITAIGHT